MNLDAAIVSDLRSVTNKTELLRKFPEAKISLSKSYCVHYEVTKDYFAKFYFTHKNGKSLAHVKFNGEDIVRDKWKFDKMYK